jgi:membrane protein insertase Oxa1/YidC/SpoIIIJ
MTPEQAQQQKIMQWMTLLFPVLLYSQPSGLNLYILTSTAIGIWESKRIRDHIKAQEEAQKEGRVLVDARPTRAARRRDDATTEPRKSGGLSRWLADLQARADNMRRDTDRRGRRP